MLRLNEFSAEASQKVELLETGTPLRSFGGTMKGIIENMLAVAQLLPKYVTDTHGLLARIEGLNATAYHVLTNFIPVNTTLAALLEDPETDVTQFLTVLQLNSGIHILK